MKLLKIAKHVSDRSHSCIYCGEFLTPNSFSRNPKHIFPWGIVYKCSCEKSQIWTNSIRGPTEFLDTIFKRRRVENRFTEKGFCNDLFCPICFGWIIALKNGLLMDGDKPVAYTEQKQYYITNYDMYVKLYSTDPESTYKYNKDFMGGVAINYNRSVDIFGCKSLDHNLGIISNGRSQEYGESEYKPIYDWAKANKKKIPQNMIDELKSQQF